MSVNNHTRVRVFALAADAFGGRGGIAQSTQDLIRALSGIPEVGSIDVLPRSQAEPIPGLPVGVRQFAASKSRLIYALRSMWYGLKFKPEIVYCGHAFMAPLAYTVARMARARLICHVHGLEVWQPLSLFKRRAIAASDLILCVSHYTAGKVVEITGADPKRCEVIYNTIDERFKLGDRVAARDKFSISQDALVISTVSRLDAGQRHKGHDQVIPLLKDLSKNYPNISYIVAGSGDDRARLEALAGDTDAGDIVRFLGFVAAEDLPDLYRASDLYVMPSHGEGFGIAFIEALACGTPALGLDKGGAGDALSGSEWGRAVTEADFPEALDAFLAELPQERATIAVSAQGAFGRPHFETRVVRAVAPLISRRSAHARRFCIEQDAQR